MSSRYCPTSLGFDARGLDHFGPLLGVVGHVLCEFGRRIRRHRDSTQFGQTFLDRGIADRRIKFSVERLNDDGGRILPHPQTPPPPPPLTPPKIHHNPDPPRPL